MKDSRPLQNARSQIAVNQLTTIAEATIVLQQAYGQIAWFEVAQRVDEALEDGRHDDRLFWMAVSKRLHNPCPKPTAATVH